MATIDDLKAIFKKADADKSGGLSKPEAETAMVLLGAHARHREDFDATFERLAKNHADHTIDFQETIFEKADSDGNGTLTLGEARAACAALGNRAPPGSDFELEFKQLAANRGGTEIAFEDFVRMVKH